MNEEPSVGYSLRIEGNLDTIAQTLAFDTYEGSRLVSKEVLSFKEAKIREVLITLGWKPPEQPL